MADPRDDERPRTDESEDDGESDEEPLDEVDEQGLESFPASDPPEH